jgi:hypothetical protein
MARKSDEWISVAEATKLSRLTGRRIQQLAKEGIIDSKRLGDAPKSPYIMINSFYTFNGSVFYI